MAQFTNQAQLAYNDSVINSNIAVGEILEVLSATKTAVSDSYGADSNLTYVISVVNSGAVPFTSLTVTDNLGAYTFGTSTLVPLTYNDGTVTYYINGILQPAPAVTTSGTDLVISGINVPANGNATIVYEAATNRFASPEAGAGITNTVTVSGGGITPFTATETVTAESEPELSVTKSISPVPVTENGTLTYTFLIQNTGNAPATAADLAAITDTFNPTLSNLTVAFNGEAWTAPTDYTYDETSGVFSSAPGLITVPAATFTQDATSGVWVTTPGVSTLTITGTV
ncbi:MAG: hypothetical protein IIW48_05380 [Clostridia bacterium]|nr:hypothetical protein [Clostridia bacterium]